MYSVVMLVALSAGGEMADLGHKGGCGQSASSCGSHGHHHKGGSCSTGCSSAPTCYSGCSAPSCGSCSASAPMTCSTGTCGSMAYSSVPTGGSMICTASGCTMVAAAYPSSSVYAPATLNVSLPADAKLVVNEIVTTSTSAMRTFVSPELSSVKEYTYTLRAEVVREGKVMVMEKSVDVRGGKTFNVSFNEMRDAVAAR